MPPRPEPIRRPPKHSPLLRLVSASDRRRIAKDPSALPASRISLRTIDAEDDLALWSPQPERGKSATVATRVSYEVEELMDYVISHRVGPWTTRGDFVRSAISVLLTLVQEVDPQLFAAVQYLSAARTHAQLVARTTRHKDFFDSVLATARLKRDDEGGVEARRYLRRIKEETKAISTKSFAAAWRRFFLKNREVRRLLRERA